MKMICSILLLLSLTSCVSGAFVVNVKQTSYQAEENHNITLEWMFTPRTSSSTNIHIIRCRLFADHKYFVLFHLLKGVEVPESQDKQFTGRVRWDKDVLRDGRIRLHMSRLRINDSGWYQCDMHTGDGRSSGICRLKVTAAADEPKPPTPRMRPQPERPTMRPQPESLENLSLSFGLIALLVLCAGLSGLCFALLLKFTGKRGNLYRAVKTMSSLEKKVIKTNQVTTSSAEIRSCLEGNPQAAKTCVNSCETQCPTTYHNLNHSRSMPNFNHSRSMPDLNQSRSIPNFNQSRSIPNFNQSRSMPNFNHSRSMPDLNQSRSMHNLNHSSSMFNSINF